MKVDDGGSSRNVSKTLSEANQYLTFMLGDELYGVDILRVQEIKGYQKCTPIPNTPVFIKGVLNLRGTIVPIVDLRAKFNLPPVEATMFTVVIVVVVKDRIMGLIVDAVSEVMDIASADIQPPPMLGTNVDVSFISGLGRCGERLITILNIDHVLSLEELLHVGSTSEEIETVQA
ncbi:chemotaxis protein CheW [Nitrospira sp. Nam74]